MWDGEIKTEKLNLFKRDFIIKKKFYHLTNKSVEKREKIFYKSLISNGRRRLKTYGAPPSPVHASRPASPKEGKIVNFLIFSKENFFIVVEKSFELNGSEFLIQGKFHRTSRKNYEFFRNFLKFTRETFYSPPAHIKLVKSSAKF